MKTPDTDSWTIRIKFSERKKESFGASEIILAVLMLGVGYVVTLLLLAVILSPRPKNHITHLGEENHEQSERTQTKDF